MRRPGPTGPRSTRATGASGGGGCFGGIGAAGRPAEHRGDEARLGLVGGRAGPDDPPVAQDRDGVGELEDLAEEVRDEDDRPATARSARTTSWRRSISVADRLAVGSSRTMRSASRASARRISTCCCSASGRRPTIGPAVEVEAGVGDQPVEPVARACRRSMKPARLGSAPRKTFWATVSLGTRATSWATIAIPLRQGLARGAERDGRPAQDQVALVLREDAGDDLAERRLAGAVLADERVDRAGPDRHRDVVEGSGRPEGLAEPANVEVGGVAGRGGHRVSRRWSARQPGHSASGRKCIDVGLGHDAAVRAATRAGPCPGAGVPVRMAWMSCSVPEAALGGRHLHDGAEALAGRDALEGDGAAAVADEADLALDVLDRGDRAGDGLVGADDDREVRVGRDDVLRGLEAEGRRVEGLAASATTLISGWLAIALSNACLEGLVERGGLDRPDVADVARVAP